MTSRVLSSPNFSALLKVLFLGAVNDNTLKNALLVLLAFSGYTVFGLPTSQVVNLAVLLFILPFFLFSSYAGKLADSSCKVKIIRLVKLCEIFIMLAAVVGFLYHIIGLILLALFAMGIHSTVFGPIKYSIVPQYLPRKDLVMANGYIELGTFAGILLGQSIGSWFMANNYVIVLIITMLLISFIGYYYSLKLADVAIVAKNIKFYKNPFKDAWLMYRSVTMDSRIRKNLHAISWFWAFGVIFTTQLPVITKDYFGGDAHIFSVIMVLFTLGIGFGSLICAKLSKGQVVHSYVVFGACGMSLGYGVLLLTHHQHLLSFIPCYPDFLLSANGILTLLLCLFIGLSAGFYSVTCYNELQLTSPDEIRSQVISATNISNAAYMVGASIASAILLMFISVWWLLMLTAAANLLFAILFATSQRHSLANL